MHVQDEYKRLVKEPDIVIHGHSHKFGIKEEADVLYINPGSAGPARFTLPRTAAILELREKVCSCAAIDVITDYDREHQFDLLFATYKNPAETLTDH